MTFGCKVNQHETREIEEILVSRGHVKRVAGDGCDVCIVNTCAVTEESVRKMRQAIRRVRQSEPDALLAVRGCFSQLEPQAANALGASLVSGCGGAREFARAVDAMFEAGSPTEAAANAAAVAEDPSRRTRALLKIQDGCDNSCAYCIIPYARGRARSVPMHTIVEEAARHEAGGYREIVVTGVEITSYGLEACAAGDGADGAASEKTRGEDMRGEDMRGRDTLCDALREISKAAPSARLRLGSLNPVAVTEGFCRELSELPKLCDHFHLSLQSGCDATLRRMGRGYGTDTVREAITSLRARFPNCGVTADLITGFPGETEAEFMQTLGFIKECAFSRMHIFPFSRRPGTRAADMPDQIVKSVRKRRAGMASAIASDMAEAFRQSQIGKTVEVLFERERGGVWGGHAGNYMEVFVKKGGGRNTLLPVRITSVNGREVWGEIV
jgi:threonylcarbamoyladenosine tRNA methylthiotransferase MtaB